MHLTLHSLQQIDDAYIQSLEPEALRRLSVQLLADLKEARDRLNQGPDNSSRPPSSRAPWERTVSGSASADDAADGGFMPSPADAKAADVKAADAKAADAKAADAKAADAKAADTSPKRKPGKQPGAPGMGRTQVFQAHEEQTHYPRGCAGCGQPLTETTAVAYTGFQAVDLRRGDPGQPGLTLWVVNHRYCETACGCGHRTRAVPGQGAGDPLLTGIALSEWRVVGPGLAALIVALALRFRLSRARIRELLGQWLGLDLSLGTIHQTIHEASAVVAPAEAELVEAVLASDLLHADETTWPEHGQLLWLWVFQTVTVTLYYVAGRGRELVDNVLDGFGGWLMSDGWIAYRHYPRRLRCWAHLFRKARGLAQSCDREARRFGQQVFKTLEGLMAAIYAAREGPPTSAIYPPNTPWRWPRCARPVSNIKAAITIKSTPWRSSCSTIGRRSSRCCGIRTCR